MLNTECSQVARNMVYGNLFICGKHHGTLKSRTNIDPVVAFLAVEFTPDSRARIFQISSREWE